MSIYIAIDLKSFYASVECVERHLDPLKANLVVADATRTNKTICLAVSPALKAMGVPGRPRLFEVEQRIRDINDQRKKAIHGQAFTGCSIMAPALEQNPRLKVDYITAIPRMSLYMAYSAQVYRVYLKYIAPEDIHVYSIDEVFMDVTHYLRTWNKTPRELAITIIRDILSNTGITATAGIGTNLYLSKVAMDIVAKHIPADEDGVRIAELDEMTYRSLLWTHRPLTDFWRVGRGYARKLEANGMFTMGDVARCALQNPELLYRLFGIQAELLIDHSFGIEPVTIADIKAYRPSAKSISSGQVLQDPYTAEKARIIVREMTELLVLDLVKKQLLTDQIVLSIGYDVINLTNPQIRKQYQGEIHIDYYGRSVPKHAHGSARLDSPSSSTAEIVEAMLQLYDQIINPILYVRRINVVAAHVIHKEQLLSGFTPKQLELFVDYKQVRRDRQLQSQLQARENRTQHALIDIQNKFGKNSILKGTNFEPGAMTRIRNHQIGGHKA